MTWFRPDGSQRSIANALFRLLRLAAGIWLGCAALWSLRVVAFCCAPASALWPSGLALVWFNSGRCPDALAALGANASLLVDVSSFVAFRSVVANL